MNAADLIEIAVCVTKDWALQRSREYRRSVTESRRKDIWKETKVAFTDVAEELMDKAYNEVSGNGALPASQRQMYYAVREEFRERTGNPIKWERFTALLRKHLNLPHTDSWKVTRDPRGTLIEPHTGEEIGMGTLKIDQYLSDMAFVTSRIPTLDGDFPTCGPKNRYQALLYVEKEGWNPLFKAVHLAERFDIAIMSCKGQSVIAARKLVDEICHDCGIPLLVLHDFDKSGFSICQNLSTISWAAEEADRVAYRFKNKIKVIDLGLRLKDVERLELKPEQVEFIGDFDGGCDITEEEKEFLRSGQRVELNAIIRSEDFVAFVEEKLRGAGIKEKLIPADDVLMQAYHRAKTVSKINAYIEELDEDEEVEPDIFKTLRRKIQTLLKSDKTLSWDAALYQIVSETVAE